ncbi:hypothetical protein Hanom_Chr06g00482331 [Helianthus anomalus]
MKNNKAMKFHVSILVVTYHLTNMQLNKKSDFENSQSDDQIYARKRVYRTQT